MDELKRFPLFRACTDEELQEQVLGVARPSLSRVISELLDEGVLSREGNDIVLKR